MTEKKCPGQDSIVKGPKDVEFKCLKCGNVVEVWPPALGAKRKAGATSLLIFYFAGLVLYFIIL